MLILRSNPKGGRALKQNHFPLHQDKDGNFGYLIGYLEDGDKILIPIPLAIQIANQLGTNNSTVNGFVSRFKSKEPLKVRLAKWILGRKEYNNLVEQEEIGD